MFFLPRTESLVIPEAVSVSERVQNVKVYGHVNKVSHSHVLFSFPGRFGMAIVSYFRFTRWLLLLNFFIFTIMFCVIVVPFLVLRTPRSFEAWEALHPTNESGMFHTAHNCTNHYRKYIDNLTSTESIADKVLDFMKGTVSTIFTLT